LKPPLEGACASLIVRLGDFFGPSPGNNWFSQGLVKPNQPVTSITNPGNKGIGHEWAYLPDAGEVFAELMARGPELSDFERFHFRGHWDADGTEMIAAILPRLGGLLRRVKRERVMAVRKTAFLMACEKSVPSRQDDSRSVRAPV
jgi:nucleoside-diphosphate-sugar epimerase